MAASPSGMEGRLSVSPAALSAGLDGEPRGPGGADEPELRDLEAGEHDERRGGHRRRPEVDDGSAPEHVGGARDGARRGGGDAVDESLHGGLRSMAAEEGGANPEQTGEGGEDHAGR